MVYLSLCSLVHNACSYISELCSLVPGTNKCMHSICDIGQATSSYFCYPYYFPIHTTARPNMVCAFFLMWIKLVCLSLCWCVTFVKTLTKSIQMLVYSRPSEKYPYTPALSYIATCVCITHSYLENSFTTQWWSVLCCYTAYVLMYQHLTNVYKAELFLVVSVVSPVIVKFV